MPKMPKLSRRWIVREAVIGGLIGGATFASGQILYAALAGFPPGAPWQLFASLLMGRGVTVESLTLTSFVIGGIIHFGLSACFGALFGLVVSNLRRRVRNDLGYELSGGIGYGLFLWLLNQQVIARLFYPWYLDFNPAVQALLHGLFFGLPLASWLTLRIRDVETPGVHAARHRYQTSSGDEEYLRLRQWERHTLGLGEEEEEVEPSGTRVPPPQQPGQERPAQPT